MFYRNILSMPQTLWQHPNHRRLGYIDILCRSVITTLNNLPATEEPESNVHDSNVSLIIHPNRDLGRIKSRINRGPSCSFYRHTSAYWLCSMRTVAMEGRSMAAHKEATKEVKNSFLQCLPIREQRIRRKEGSKITSETSH